MQVSPQVKFFCFRFTTTGGSTTLEYKPVVADVVSPKSLTAIIPEKYEDFYINPLLIPGLGGFMGGFSMWQVVVPRSFYVTAFPVSSHGLPLIGDWWLDGNAELYSYFYDYISSFNSSTGFFDSTWDPVGGSPFLNDFFDHLFFPNGGSTLLDSSTIKPETFLYRVNSYSFDDDFFYVNLLRHPVPNRSIFLWGKTFQRLSLPLQRPLVKIPNKLF